ncbi:MAG: NADH:flavin oxidoreductase [Bdellovibrionales bacterium]|nr:NADH:flavin oxidoreductase [Bdellovibrionales bacterium]
MTRFSPLKLRNNLELSNRIVIPPMASTTADLKGNVTEATLSHYSRLSESQAAMVMVEYTYVHESGKSEEQQLGISSHEQIMGLSLISRSLHQRGAIAGIQLTHSGGKTESIFTGGVLQSPSGIIVPVKDKILETPAEMNLNDIQNWKKWFSAAVDRAVKAKFDLVELHAAHGYGLNQWLSPITNHRKDSYGGNLENNSRLLLEIVSEVRNLYPDLLISVRMPGQDFLEGGLSNQDCLFIAQALEALGVDMINISSGIGGWKRPDSRRGEGYLVEEAAFIQAKVSIPVIGVGGIESGTYIDQLLATQKISLAAVGRAILNNPKQWGETQLRSHCYV